MRDPNRLEPLYKRLAELHGKVPDQRMSQFLMNVLGQFERDPFYMEDTEFMQQVEKIVNGWLPGNRANES